MATERIVHVVDDDPAVRRSLGQLLYSADFEYVGYESAVAFLEAASGISAGCVLLDVKMPESMASLCRANSPTSALICRLS
jgi:two-component system response regulator FixJ